MTKSVLLSSLALVALTACGGGGGGTITFPPTTLGGGTASYAQLQNDVLNFNSYRANGVSSSLPSSGSANYGGTMVVADDLYNGSATLINGNIIVDTTPISANGYLGEVSLTANFSGGGGSVSGTVTNWYGTTLNTTTGAATGSTGAVSGSLSLTGGSFTGTNGFTMNVGGSLAGETAGGQLIVGFFGPNGQSILAESQPTGGMTLNSVNTDARLSARQ